MKELLEELMNAASGPPIAYPPLQIIVRLAIALVIGFVLAIIYQRTYTGLTFSKSIFHTQVLLAVGGALIWLVVGDNLVRAFGLAGTIGLIRYRTRISDPKDTTVLLFSMILGMACGLGQLWIALIGLGFVVIGLYLLSILHPRRATDSPIGAKELQDLMDLRDEDEVSG